LRFAIAALHNVRRNILETSDILDILEISDILDLPILPSRSSREGFRSQNNSAFSLMNSHPRTRVHNWITKVKIENWNANKLNLPGRLFVLEFVARFELNFGPLHRANCLTSQVKV